MTDEPLSPEPEPSAPDVSPDAPPSDAPRSRLAVPAALGAGAAAILLAAVAALSANTSWSSVAPHVVAALFLLGGLLGRGALSFRAGDAPASLASEGRGLLTGLLAAAVLLVPLTLALPLWGPTLGLAASPSLPTGLAGVVAFMLLAVAIPEEAFYRGFLQQALDDRWGRRWGRGRWRCGPGLLVATLVFAGAHLAIYQTPLALIVFFPGLLFGLLYARRNAVLAAAAFHAACNIAWLFWGGWPF